jgi:hypothetical protein
MSYFVNFDNELLNKYKIDMFFYLQIDGHVISLLFDSLSNTVKLESSQIA